MEKLIWVYNSTDGYTYSCEIAIPFEYESKDKFIYDVLEAARSVDWEFEHSRVELLGVDLTSEQISDLERDVFTIYEWFARQKQSLFEPSRGYFPPSEKTKKFIEQLKKLSETHGKNISI